MNRQTEYVVVMGVSGSGKTEVARRLASKTDNICLDADDHHPKANVERMSRGVALNDEMRWPWLEAVAKAAQQVGQTDKTVFIACSALKRSYRDLLREKLGQLSFVFLEGTRDVIQTRLESRVGHFMPSALLDSQLADLEPPGPDENCVTVFIDAPIETVVSMAVTRLENHGKSFPSFIKDNIAGKPALQGENK
ncbi:gluconokinase [Thalassospira australica]|uniref:gluconokinase n=1 Tax=Thalassospira australica TaxID=1528106 RepID=UPI00051A690B|nr:gluconokinase [Thalassospira australica]